MDKHADKLYKKSIRDQQKRIKPTECHKYIRLVIDSHVMSAPYGREFMSELRSLGEYKYEMRTLPIKESLKWERSFGQLKLNHENGLSAEWQEEEQIIKIVHHSELQNLINKKAIHAIRDEFISCFPGKTYIVLYIRPKDKQSNQTLSALIELEVLYQLKVYEVSTKEIIPQIQRMTKAIAEIPYKKQKSEILGSFKKFLANDKKQCVRIDGTNGFNRLWQQHLNRLPLVTLEIAETIINQYPCPKKLLDNLKNNSEAVAEIGDLKIKRSGPIALQTDRRIGNVLAYKLYMLYNSTDPTTTI